MKKINMLIMSSLLGIFFSLPAMAVTPGEPGGTSTARLDMSVTLLPEAQVSGLTNIVTNDWKDSPRGFYSAPSSFCVYSTQASNAYYITVQGANTATELPTGYTYRLNNPLFGSTDHFAYAVAFQTIAPTIGTAVDLVNGQKYQTSFAGSDVPDCGGVNNAAFTLHYISSKGPMKPVTNGLYTDVLTVTVTPV
ncbi:MAG: hypothetical protein EXR81_04620 [Gammaproteobacteria bacterium]|nr:hypothetical protein [Gammaproteobacteria bacterium]